VCKPLLTPCNKQQSGAARPMRGLLRVRCLKLPPVTSAVLPLRSKSWLSWNIKLDRLAHVDIVSGKYFRMRSSAVRACASMPSRREMRAVAGARALLASRLARCQVSGLRNLCTERPAE